MRIFLIYISLLLAFYNTAILGIDAGSSNPLVDLTSDLGAIMISEYTNNHFIGSTISTSESGSQPFSGNREWGLLTNQNGNLEIYTRAVDVATISDLIKSIPSFLGSNPEDNELTYYDIADVTWKNLQNKVKNWINENGGQADISTTEAIKVDKEKIKELLESNQTIDQIGCN